MKRPFKGFFFLFIIGPFSVLAQSHHFPLNNDIERYVLKHASDSQYNFHSTIREYDEVKIENLDQAYVSFKKESGLFGKGIANNAALEGGEKVKYEVSPIIYALLTPGNTNINNDDIPEDLNDNNYWLGAGIQTRLSYSDKLAFGFNYTFSHFTFPLYVDEKMRLPQSQFQNPDESNANVLMPWFGEATKLDDGAYNNHFYTGYLDYSPAEYFQMEIGRGKHFYGNGYRSLLLSDYADAYPYGKLLIDIWKIKYQVLYSQYKDRNLGISNDLQTKLKYSTSNYLSMNIGKHANVSLFQSVIWQAEDSLHDRGFDVNYLNPFIFMRPVEFSIGSPDNMLLGLDFSYTVYKKHKFYAQIILDEFLLDEIRSGDGWWGNKYGYQLGLEFNDFFRMKGVQFRMEYNEVRPYTYAHTNVVQNYAHNGYELAHPFGANFKEGLVQFSKIWGRWMLNLHVMHARQGFSRYVIQADDSYALVNYGESVFRSNLNRQEYGNYTTQGELGILNYQKINASYLINPKWSLLFDLGFSHRTFELMNRTNSNYMMHFGFRTTLYNQYFDF